MEIGIVTGLKTEAACAGGAGMGAVVACHGPGPRRAAMAAQALLTQNVKVLVSFGIAGGLAPYLEPGDVVIATGVRDPEGHITATDRIWTARLNHAVARLGLRPYSGRLLGNNRPIYDPVAKHKAFDATGALAVDMESHAVAAVAEKHSLPFIAIRVVADPADVAVPRLALAGLRPDGSIHVLPVLVRAIRRPWIIPTLARLGSGHKLAIKRLWAIAPALSGAGASPLGRP